ncbi:MAG: hypothetical protein FWC27_11310, partial [Firmicutes bacterium]|nr:hypothetical protein [Bacillota bacterium]
GLTPANVPESQFVALLGRPLPPKDIPAGAPITLNDSLEDALRLHPTAQSAWDLAIDPILQLIMKAMTNGAYVSNALQAPMFCYRSMTSGVLDDRAVGGILKVCNEDWSGLLDIAASVPNIITNLPKLMENA